MNHRINNRLIWLVLFLIVAIGVTQFFPLLFSPFTNDGINTFVLEIDGGILLVALLASIVLLSPGRVITTAHGSAHFATSAELRTYENLVTSQREEQQAVHNALISGKTAPSKMHLGMYHNRLIALDEHMQESHVLLLAPTGVGKTSRIIIPSLLQEYGSRSLFINDTKGELRDLTFGHLSRYHRCFVFAPTEPQKSHHYNPLAHVHTMDDAEALASCLIDNTGKSREEFWNSAPKLLVASTILHLRAAEPEAPFSRLIDILCSTKLEDIKTLFQSSPSSIAQDIAQAFFENLQKNDRLAGSIMVDMVTRFFRFKNPSLREVTSSNDLDFTRMTSEPTVLLLSIPEGESERLEPLSACLIMQAMNSILRGGRVHVAFYLDEFCNAGVIPKFTTYISTVRSRGVTFILAVQNFGQGRDTYGANGWETILANCNTHIAFPGCGLPETRYYSEKLGKTTVGTTSSSGLEGSSWLVSQRTRTQGETQRDLMTSDEIRTMPDGSLLVFISKYHPVLVQNTPYYLTPELVARTRLPYTLTTLHTTINPKPSILPAPVMNQLASGTENEPGQPQPSSEAAPNNQSHEHFFSPE